MKSLWNTKDLSTNDLALRVYSSRLLGQNPALVLHGGGNTSVKMDTTNIFGESEEILYVKGSGWDLASIEVEGFAPVKLDVLKKMVLLDTLSDLEMVRVQRAAMTNPHAPNPSVEAILHAIIPFKYVDHTHADAIVTITNTAQGAENIRQIYGDSVLIIPYVMAGFSLAQTIFEKTQGIDWAQLEGIILMNHGIFTFGDEAKSSYEQMIHLVTQAEHYLQAQEAIITAPIPIQATEDLLALARIRHSLGDAIIVTWDVSPESVHFSNRSDVKTIATRGPLTPDHVIRTKPIPVILGADPEQDILDYTQHYHEYFKRHTDGQLTCLNPMPCWAIWPGFGVLSFGRSVKEVNIVSDIKDHTIQAIQTAELLGGWKALPESKIFEMEYWELEQAKLRKNSAVLPLQGKIALVTGASSGIGYHCVKTLQAQGAAIVAVDINPNISTLFTPQKDILGIVCDMTCEKSIQNAVNATIRHFGGLDIIISNAGTFPPSETCANMSSKNWSDSLAINLTSHQQLLQAAIPYLTLSHDAAVIMIASKNVAAPGPGASAYSVAKAGQTQLARVAALELGEYGVRVNIIHPNAVFDTGIWTTEVLEKRAKHYGMSVEAYKSNNILKKEVTSQEVATLACAMAGPIFAKTTGAQIPIDGGNERVI